MVWPVNEYPVNYLTEYLVYLDYTGYPTGARPEAECFAWPATGYPVEYLTGYLPDIRLYI